MGNQGVLTLDANGNVLPRAETEYNQFPQSAETRTTGCAWDVRNRNPQVTEDPGGLGLVAQKRYDSTGDLVVVIDAAGRWDPLPCAGSTGIRVCHGSCSRSARG